MRKSFKKGLAGLIATIMVASLLEPFGVNDQNVVQAAEESEVTEEVQETKEPQTAFVTEKTLTLSDGAYSLTGLKMGTMYQLTVTAESAPTVTISVNKNGSVYDGTSYYQKDKTMADEDGDGTYTVQFETPAVDYDEIVLTISGTYSEEKLYEESYVEIDGKPTKNQLAVGGTVSLSATLSGLSSESIVTWSSQYPDVATVTSDENGVTLEALSLGKTEITATVIENDVTYEDYFELYVVNESLTREEYGLVLDSESLVDFTLNVPSGEDIRILQFSDTQIINADKDTLRVDTDGTVLTPGSYALDRWGTENAIYENCHYYIEKTFEELKATGTLPHLVVLAGDNRYGQFDDDGKMLDALIAELDAKCATYGCYWTFVFGNHDKESDIGIEETLRRYSKSQRCLYAYREVSGDSNMSVAIKQDDAYAQIEYLFDTHSTGSGTFKGNRVDEWATLLAGIYDSQVEWFESVAATYPEVPSQVYMHIAFEEYASTFANHGYGVDYSTITTSSVDAYTSDDNTYGDFGEIHEKVSIWDDNKEVSGTDFYRTLTEHNVTGTFCGHNHQNNYSVVTDKGIRLTFGLKTGTYDAYYQGQLGGTLITANGSDLDVEHVYAIKRTEENFDVAGPYGVNTDQTLIQMKTSSMAIEWGEGFGVSLVDEDEKGRDKAVKLTVRESGSKYFMFRVPEVEAGRQYKVTYHLTQSNASTANEPRIAVSSQGMEIVGDARNNFSDGTMDFYFQSTVHAKRPTAMVYIWFWGCSAGDTIILDDFTFEDVTGENLDEAVPVYNDEGELTYIHTSTMPVEWTDGLDIEVIDDTDYEGDKAIQLTFNGLEGADRMFAFRVPEIKDNSVYRITYTIKQDNKDIANCAYLNATGAQEQQGKVTHQFTGAVAMESVVISPVNRDSSDEYTPYVAIWFWNNKVGDTVIIDDFQFVEVFDVAEGDYNADNTGNTVKDLVRLMREFANLKPAARLAETSGNGALDADDKTNLMKALLGIGKTLENVENDDGTFEGNEGIISLYSAHDISGSYGADWANDLTFTQMLNDDGTSIAVTSTGTSSYDNLLIKFNQPVKKGQVYNIHMKLSARDSVQKDMKWIYFISDETGFYSEAKEHVMKGLVTDLGYEALFDENGVTISFTATEDCDTFCFMLFDNTAEKTFNFEIDNISLEYLGYEVTNSILNDDGSFEGNEGGISLYSPTVLYKEGGLHTNPAYACDYGARPVSFRKVETDEGIHTTITSTNTDRIDYVYIEFAEKLKAGVKYTITYDATWNGETQPTSYGYAIIPDIGNYVANEDDNITNYDSTIKWFEGSVSITFTPTADLDHEWYLVFMDQTSGLSLDMTIDNIKLSTNVVLNDDGTFEGNAGNVSLYSASELDKSILHSSPKYSSNYGKTSFRKVLTETGTALEITSNTTHHDYVYMKFSDTPLTAGQTYKITYDATWNGDGAPTTSYGCAVIPTIANYVNADTNMMNYKSIKWFDGAVTITFTPKADITDDWYLVLLSQNSGITLNFTIDNIVFTKVTE